MQIKFLRPAVAISAVLSLFITSCTKIDTTTLGQDLIPAVDNINTFEQTLDITATQGEFNDKTKLGVSDNYIVGKINSDPMFGTTSADMFFELKPSFYKYIFGDSTDVLNGPDAGLDSMVLCLAYKGFYGDTTLPQHLTVYQLPDGTTNFKDSSYTLDFQPNQGLGTQIGDADVSAKTQDLAIYHFNPAKTDSFNNQIRIKLSSAFANELWSRDTGLDNSKNAFRSDEDFRRLYKGFAVVGDNSQNTGIFYVNLADAKTRLEIYYRKKDTSNNTNVIDTTVVSLPFISSTLSDSAQAVSAHANYVKRDRTGSEYKSSTQPGDFIYLQATPGTYATLKVPGLTGLTNRIIHRAEIIVEGIPGDPLDTILYPPSYLYLDLVDNSGPATKYKPVYFDLSSSQTYNPDDALGFLPASGIDNNYFGGYLRHKTDQFNNRIAYYTFNVSRHVQNIATNGKPNYDFRLYAPYELNYYGYVLPFNNNLAYGRVKVGSGTNTNYRMRMHIVYSNL